MTSNIWSIYLLKCSDGSIYAGISNNVDKRIIKHNTGKGSRYVAARLPAKLLFQKEIGTKSEAAKEEYRVKQLSRAEKLNYIKG